LRAHAAITGLLLVSRDPRRVKTCFPTVELITLASPSQAVPRARMMET